MNFEFRQHPIKPVTIVASVVISVLVGAVIILLAGSNPLEVYSIILVRSLGSEFALSSTLRWMTPVLLTGIAAAVSFRGGLFNIGIEGQMYIGAFSSAFVGFSFYNLPAAVHIPLCILAGMLGGLVYALVPALLQHYYNANEMVVGLMMNYVAMYLTDYLVRYHFIAGGTFGTSLVTEEISSAAALPPLLSKGQANWGLVIALLAAVCFWVMIKKSKLGYEIHITGLNPRFSHYGGVNVMKTRLKVMLISGAMAGLAGTTEVLGILNRFQTRFSPDFGNDGIVVAFLGANTPAGTLIAAFVMGVIKAGVLSVERYTNVSRSLAMIIQAIILTFISTKMLSNSKVAALLKSRISGILAGRRGWGRTAEKPSEGGDAT